MTRHRITSTILGVAVVASFGLTFASSANASAPVAKRPTVSSVTSAVIASARANASANQYDTTCFYARQSGPTVMASNWAVYEGDGGAGSNTAYDEIVVSPRGNPIIAKYLKLSYNDRVQVGLNYLRWLCG